MPDKNQVISDLNYLSERISNRVWTVSLSVLAFGWTFIDSAGTGINSIWLLAAIAMAFLALLADLVQYLAGIALSRQVLRDMESHGQETRSYDASSLWFRMRQLMFYSKVLLATTATLSIVGALAWKARRIVGLE